MLFNSNIFTLFFISFFFLFWFVFNGRVCIQNILIVIASYIFYGWWDWRFLSLIIASSFIDYFIAQRISASGESDAINKVKIDKYYTLLLENDLSMLGQPTDFLYSSDMFYDTRYHLTTQGQLKRSEKLSTLLKMQTLTE